MASIRGVAGHQPQAINDVIAKRDDGGFDVQLHQARLDRATGDWVPTGRRLSAEVTREVPVDSTDADVARYTDTKEVGVAWPAALEKTFAGVEPTWSRARQLAVVDRGYDRLNNGGNEWQMAEAMTQLTGRRAGVMPLDRTEGTDAAATKAKEAAVEGVLAKQLADGKPVIIGTIASERQDGKLPLGLYGSHAYEVTSVTSGTVQLENPWNKDHPQPMTVRQLLDHTRGAAATLRD